MRIFSRISIVLAVLLSLNACVNTSKQEEANTEKPNLIVIHTDEHNFRTLSCYQKLMTEDQAFVWGKGNNVLTPNIDRIANEGAISVRYYASSPVCTPSRASILTGLYPVAAGAPVNGLPLSKSVETFAHSLNKEGYSTSYVGKWHLAGGHDKYKFGIKYNGGFTDNRYMMTGGHAPYLKVIGDSVVAGINPKQASKYDKSEYVHATDFFVDRTLEILERDKDKPFALMLSIPDPHTPDYARAPYKTMYDDMDVQAPTTFDLENADNKPKWGKRYEGDNNQAKEFNADALRQYFGMVKHIDDRVGDILQFLDDNGLSDNTIIVFTSDHGDMFFEHTRKNKDLPYEASARIPFVIRYPNKIPAGKIMKKAYSNIDFTPTMLSLMNVESDVKYHGLNTADDFTSDEKLIDGDRIVYVTFQTGIWTGAFDNRYKLVLSKQDRPVLLDIVADPNELINYYDDPTYKAIADRLQTELIKQMDEYKEPGLTDTEEGTYILE